MIKAVYFDFDNTLGNREVYAYRLYKEALKNCGIQDPVEMEAVLQACMVYDQNGETNKNYVKDRIEKEFAVSFPVDDFNAFWETHLCDYTVPFNDAEKTLQVLKDKGYLLGIITNGNSYGQHKKIESSGLLQYFDAVIVSADVGAWKPDGKVFAEALKQLGVRPEESVMVGDVFAKDVLGAYRAGMYPVWFNLHRFRFNEAGIREIYRICEIIDVVESLNSISDTVKVNIGV